MRLSLELIVIAIVLLVVALVVLTIFGGGIASFQKTWGGSAGEALRVQQCQSQCTIACQGVKEETPVTVTYVNNKGEKVDCPGECKCKNSVGTYTESKKRDDIV